MKNYSFLLYFVVLLLSIVGCKSEFEKIRTSNDTDLLYTKANEYYQKEDYGRAQELYEKVLGNLRGRVEAEDAYYYYAYCHYYQGLYLLANYYFNDFSSKFLNSERREESDFMSYYSFYKLSPNYRLDQTQTQKAIDGFQLFVNTYPNSTRVDECTRLMEEMRKKQEVKAIEEATLYYNLERYQAAIQVFSNTIAEFPDSDRLEELRYFILDSKYQYAIKSIATKQYERLLEAKEEHEKFVRRYPLSVYQNELEVTIKNIERKLKEFDNDGHKI